MDVVLNGYLEINSVDYSAYIEGVETNFDLAVQESTPFTSTSVKKDPGLFNNSFTVNIAELSTWAFTIAMYAIQGTKVAFEIRPDGASVGAANPKWTGSCIVPQPSPSIVQGEGAKYQMTFEVDGAVTQATS